MVEVLIWEGADVHEGNDATSHYSTVKLDGGLGDSTVQLFSNTADRPCILQNLPCQDHEVMTYFSPLMEHGRGIDICW